MTLQTRISTSKNHIVQCSLPLISIFRTTYILYEKYESHMDLPLVHWFTFVLIIHCTMYALPCLKTPTYKQLSLKICYDIQQSNHLTVSYTRE